MVNPEIWHGRRVLVTGHTGFKGSWLSLWLADLGAKVTGYALPPPTVPSLFEQARVEDVVDHIEGDVRDLAAVEAAIARTHPDVVFHLAAQPLVRYSYAEPVETYATNVMGTVHILEACRKAPCVKAVVAVTTDKCYENHEQLRPYRESDPMGGHDPYSSSKGAAELVIAGYRRSFFAQGAGVASVRAGNVIGGGDWALDRLIPDIMRALAAGKRPSIRAPDSVRPWQHVLEALGGYLLIAERLLAGDRSAATAWNFGPADDDARPVRWLVEQILAEWGAVGWDAVKAGQLHEAQVLRLDTTKARTALGWRPALTLSESLRLVVAWHKAVAGGADARAICQGQLAEYSLKSSQSCAEPNP
jgi:CDP-glucose 4,6-dehydratase